MCSCFIGPPVVSWIHTSGGPMQQEHMDDQGLRCFGMRIDCGDDSPEVNSATLLLLFNAHDHALDFTLPPSPAGTWRLLLDTRAADGGGGLALDGGERLQLEAFSLALLSGEGE
jgi:pullulanase/glycogen debranching enzyme